jgi:hypothetical protein
MILATYDVLLTLLVLYHVYRTLVHGQDFTGDLLKAMGKIVTGRKDVMVWPSRKSAAMVANHPAEEGVDTRRFATAQGRLDTIATVVGPKKTEPFLARDGPETAASSSGELLLDDWDPKADFGRDIDF